MRHRLRVLLVGSAVALAISVVTMVTFALATESSGPSSTRSAITSASAGNNAGTGATTVQASPTSGAVTGSQLCGMVTSGEVYRLLNSVSWPTEPGAPLPTVRGAACTWGTGFGETFKVTVEPRSPGAGTHPCAGLDGTVIQTGGWVGCSRLQFGPGVNVLRAFKGSYVVSVLPQVNVVGDPYLTAEESTITHVFQQLGS